MNPHKPSQEEILTAADKTVPDVIASELKVLFCGINPGLYSAAVAHHFARPGNRFWPALQAAAFTDRLLSPFEEYELLRRGYGITNIVERATASADQLSVQELTEGRRCLETKVQHYHPRFVAILGIGAYRTAFGRKASLGQQSEKIGDSTLWVLPNPSGLNAHYRPKDLAELFRDLRLAVEHKPG